MKKSEDFFFKEGFPKKILVLRLSGMGNVIFSLPVVSALRNRFPQAEISFLSHSSYLPLLSLAGVHRPLGLERSSWRRGFHLGRWLHGYQRHLPFFMRKPFDVVIDLQSFFETTVLTGLSRAPLRLGLLRHLWQKFFYTHTLPVRPRKPGEHQVEEFLRLLRTVGWDFPFAFPQIQIPTIEKNKVASRHASCPRPWIGINLGASSSQKRYPWEKMKELIISCQSKGSLFLLWGPQEKDLVASIQNTSFQKPIFWIPPQGIQNLAVYLSQMDLVISSDTGPLHLTCATGTPVIGLFEKGYEERYKPLVQDSQILTGSTIGEIPLSAILESMEIFWKTLEKKGGFFKKLNM